MSLPMLAVSAFVIALSGAMMPGPLLTYCVNGSLRRGFIAGPLIITGHAILELLLVILLLSGLNNLFSSDLFAAVVGIIGGFVLIVMAADMIKSAVKKEVSLEKEVSEESSKEVKPSGFIIPGALVSLSNPYWTIWWATIGITYLVSASQQGIAGAGAFFVGHITADYVWYALIAFVVSRGRKFLNDRIYRYLIIFFALVLVYFGLTFLSEGLQFYWF